MAMGQWLRKWQRGDAIAGGGARKNLALWLKGSALLLSFSLVYMLCTSIPKLRILSQTRVYGSIFTPELLYSQFALDLLWFTAAFALIHLLLAGLIILCWRYWSPRWLIRESSGYLLLLVWGAIMLLVANRCFFPRSFFSGGEEASTGIWIIFWAGALLWSVLLVGHGLLHRAVWIMLLGSCLVAWLPQSDWLEQRNHDAARVQPDVIIIGFDSLRPDVVGKTYTPHLYQHLQRAVIYPNSVTPLAHTYPAWMSILTGVDPVRHGARYNLIPDQFLNKGYRTLPEYLKRLNYQTFFAMDERRFANISSRHGFDSVEGPSVGAGDFLLSSISDVPLLNFFRQTSIAKLLFPYIYTNRAAYDAYRGDVYVDAVGSNLRQLNPEAPVFAAVHFCMAHWPYALVPHKALDEERFRPFDPATYTDEYYLRYLKAVSETDDQFGQLMAELRARGRLENALVFFISDHGESFSTDVLDLADADSPGTRWTLAVNGHGTHASIPAQYQVLLAVQAFRKGKPTLEKSDLPVEKRAGLVDILPTTLDYLGLEPERQLDGQSLLRPTKADRDFFVESGFSVPAIMGTQLDAKGALQQGIGYYRVRTSGEVEVKPERFRELLERKEYSHLADGSLLTYGNYGESQEGFRYLDLHNGTWKKVFSADAAVLVERARKICRRFSDDTRLAHEPICQRQLALKVTP